MNPLVSVYHDKNLRAYEAAAPFSPGQNYPEYRFGKQENGTNKVYEAVRESLRLLGMDTTNYGTRDWNPLGEVVKPGDRVVLKPNLVRHYHGSGGSLDCVITHGSVLRAVADFVLIAMRGRGELIIGDAPLQSADFAALREFSGINAITEFYRYHSDVPVEVLDFRRTSMQMDSRNIVQQRGSLDGDPRGYTAVNFGSRSMLSPIHDGYDQFRVTNYDPHAMALHHNQGKHEYLISGSIAAADVVISLPKLKTHRKAGITCCLKNLVGINGHKDWLPHHRRGSLASGGDEYAHPSLLKELLVTLNEKQDTARSAGVRQVLHAIRTVLFQLVKHTSKDNYLEGSWFGNDTVWRMVLDLNRALLYGGTAGELHEIPQRKTFFLVDGVIAGEGEGPLEPTAKPCGLLLAGFSAPAVDAVAARLMGYDWRKIPAVRESFSIPDLPLCDFSLEDVRVVSNDPDLHGLQPATLGRHFGFTPSEGWKGHIEFDYSRSKSGAIYPCPVASAK